MDDLFLEISTWTKSLNFTIKIYLYVNYNILDIRSVHYTLNLNITFIPENLTKIGNYCMASIQRLLFLTDEESL